MLKNPVFMRFFFILNGNLAYFFASCFDVK